MLGKAFGESLGVFAEDGGELLAVDFAEAFVVAGLEMGVSGKGGQMGRLNQGVICSFLRMSGLKGFSLFRTP